MKICQYAFGGHSKDGEAGASGEGDPQTNAFTGERIKPWALKVRVGLNCAGLLKIQQKHLFFFFFLPPECFRCLRLDVWKKHSRLFHWSCLWTFLTSIEVQIFVSSRRIYLTVSQRCLEKAREPQSIRIPEKSPDVRFLTKSGTGGKTFLTFCLTSSIRDTTLNTEAGLTQTLPRHRLLFLTFLLLKDLATVRCCGGGNWMNHLPWETNNITDPECLLSVMRPNRRLDRRKWCVVLCWDNSPGPPPQTIAARDMKCT